MEKKHKIILIPVIISIVIIGMSLFMSYQKEKLEKAVYQYLIDEKQYKDEEIFLMETFRTPGYNYSTSVIFEDERNVIYEYIKKENTILQIGWEDIPSKSRKNEIISPKHLDTNK